ncbi:MAG: hypothetical protein WC863_03380 [Patescibacteria group bacterium]
MNLFKNFNQPKPAAPSEEFFIKQAENELIILTEDLKKKNWSEVCESLRHTELNSPSVTQKMSAKAQEKFRSLIDETQQTLESERASLDEHLTNGIQEALDHIKAGFNEISEKL